MEKNEAQGKPIPLLAILEAGLLRVVDKISKDNKEITFDEEKTNALFKEMLEGVKEGVGIVGYGLHTLSAQEDQFLRDFRVLKQRFPKGFDIMVKPKNQSDTILGADGKPAEMGEKKIIVSK